MVEHLRWVLAGQHVSNVYPLVGRDRASGGSIHRAVMLMGPGDREG
jgi:hypothetical protein